MEFMSNRSDLFKSICGFTEKDISLIPNNIFTIINTDSRTIKKGDWFLPLVGEKFDGHQYIEKAMRDGASGYFYSDEKFKDIDTNSIKVLDTRKLFGQLATTWRKINNFQVIAITGSSGKTTFKELLNVFLQEHGITHRTSGNFNNEIGVPISLISTPYNADYSIIEMGARHVGDLDYLSRIAQQNVSVLLNVGNAHIGEFGNFENLVKTKCEIVKSAPMDATAIINADQFEIIEELNQDRHNRITFLRIKNLM